MSWYADTRILLEEAKVKDIKKEVGGTRHKAYNSKGAL